MFPLGQIVATPNALHTFARHVRGDWGDLCPDDARENALSLARGFRLFSVYRYDPRDPDARLWIITEADRRSTCVLLPVDY